MLILEPERLGNKDVILCKPIDLQKPKMKIFKHGFKSLIRNLLFYLIKKMYY